MPERPSADLTAGGASAAESKRPPPTVTEISSGTCSERGLRLMTHDECEAFARVATHQFIGRTSEAGEFPGCVRWGGGFIEYNQHTDEKVGCHVGGRTSNGVAPACLCAGTRKR